jgi:hypothetical protein
MVMKKLVVAASCFGLLGLSGCALTPAPLPGLFYTDMKFPSYYSGVNPAGAGPKRGTAQSTSVLGLIATGDSSIETAAKNGGIRKIYSADTHSTSILGLFSTYTTIVTGE